MLSKPLGTGVLLSQAQPQGLAAAVISMRQTNRAAAMALRSLPLKPHAVTDVSGFGFIGHLGEMLRQSNVAAIIDAADMPLLSGALAAAAAGTRTSAHRQPQLHAIEIDYRASLSEEMRVLLVDPQTSGGLLAAVDPSDESHLAAHGFRCVGKITSGPPKIQVV